VKNIGRTELGILTALGVIAMCLFAAVAILFAYEVADRRGLLASAASPTARSTLHTLPPVPQSTPKTPPTSTSEPTLLPRATNTLVISKESVNDKLLQTIEQKMVLLRNLSPVEPVSKHFLTATDLRELLSAWYAQDNPLDEVFVRQQLYLALGFLRPGDDLNIIQSELMARSVAGLYNALDKQLYIVSDRWNMTAADEMTFAHEFTHAMQDQHYHLLSFDERARTLDEQLANTALIEGDATLSMSFYAIRNLSQRDVDEMIYRAAQWKQDQLTDIPAPITQMTLFPYQAGLRFVQALYQAANNWSLVDAAFAIPPLSTEQIMHAEKYLTEPDVPLPIALPALDDTMGGNWNEIDRGVLGEFLIGLHLSQGVDPASAARAAAGWGGDSYVLLTDGAGSWLLAMRSAWDTLIDAEEFFTAYTQKLANNDSAQQITLEPTRGYWRLPDREVYASRQGKDALVIIAPDRTALDRALHWFPGY